MNNFIKFALIRAIRTMAQTMVGIIGASTLLSEVHWLTLLSASLMSGILSILTSIITGLPEAGNEKVFKKG